MRILPVICGLVWGLLVWPVSGYASENMQEEVKTLRIMNWGMYIDFDDSLPSDLPPAERSPTLREFAEKYHCQVEYHEFDTFASMMSKFSELSGFYDIMVLQSDYVEATISMGYLLPIEEEKIPNLRFEDPLARHPPPDPEGKYLVPYMSGYVGLAFRNDMLQTTNLTWREYFDAPVDWTGHMALFDSSSIMFALAIISNGGDYAHVTPEDVARATQKISHLVQHRAPQITDQPDVLAAALMDDSIWVTPLHAPDAQALLAKSTNISFIIPSDGAELYNDYLVINRDSQNSDLAFEFINFVLQPEIHGRIAAYLGADAPSEEARKVSRALAIPRVPSAFDRTGQPASGLQITYTLNPAFETQWLEIMTQSESHFDDSDEAIH